jgi:ubiquinone/menaquinone biosynthesis C-methylase UbiE
MDRGLGRRFATALACAALHVAVSTPVVQAQSGADPRINDQFLTADPIEQRTRFEGESREVYHKRAEVVAASAVKPGMTVADVGAGTGFFAMLFARAVGEQGRVFAVDISKPFVAAIAQRARDERLANVSALLGTDKDTGLPESAVDLVFTSDTYHHFVEPQPVLASIHRALKPAGRFIIVDFERIPGVSSEGRLKHVRAGKETVIREVETAGFRLAQEVKSVAFVENYFLIFERR